MIRMTRDQIARLRRQTIIGLMLCGLIILISLIGIYVSVLALIRGAP